MWKGEEVYYLDPKGRLVLPAHFRNARDGSTLDQLVLTRGFERCIAGFTLSDWEAIETKARALPMTDPKARAIQRFLVGSATACDLDRQGRLTIPAPLRAHARVGREVVVAGVGNRIEIWDKAAWERIESEAERVVESSSPQFDL